MASDLDVSSPCVKCGKPARPHEHHHPAKQMGGQGVKVEEHPTVPLCRTPCHHDVHMGDWQLKLSPDGSIAKGYENGMVIFERGLVVRDEQGNSLFWSDERLASEWADGEGKAQDGFEQQCNAAFEFYRRYRGQPEWSTRVAEIISDTNGVYVHPREVYRRIKLYIRFNADWTIYRRLGKTLALAVAESDDSGAALEIAQTARDEGGQTAAAIIRSIRGESEPPPKTCPSCGVVL